MVVNERFLLPYLMGQRRDGLRRVLGLGPDPWELVTRGAPDDERIDDPVEKLHRLGSLYARLAVRVEAALRAGRRPVSLAGDCVSSLGMLAGLQRAGQAPDRVVWLDAHGDFHTWSSTQTQYIGGMPLALFVGRVDPGPDPRNRAARACLSAIGVQAFPPGRIVLADARDLDPGEREVLLGSGIVRCRLGEVLGHLRRGERLYVHWDTDVVDDPGRLPALKYHVAHGPGADEVAAFFQALRRFDIVAVSVSAWHAELDEDDRTARGCLEILEALVGPRGPGVPEHDTGRGGS